MDKAERRSVLALPLVILIGVAISWACSQDGAVVGGFSLFALCGVLAFGINWLVFIHAWRTRSERLFDLTGLAQQIDPDLARFVREVARFGERLGQCLQRVVAAIRFDEDRQGVLAIPLQLG